MGLVTRTARVAAIHAAAGWLGAVVLIASDSDFGLADAMTHVGAARAAVVAGICGLLLARVYIAAWFRWWLGPILGVAVGGLVAIAYFVAWPHSWQASRLEAWKTASVIIGVYWSRLLPLSAAAGAASAWWGAQPVRAPRWARIPPDDEIDGAEPPAPGAGTSDSTGTSG